MTHKLSMCGLLMLLVAVTNHAYAQSLVSGGMVPGSITQGETDTYSFHAESGDTISVSMGDKSVDPSSSTSLYPYLTLLNPNGTQLGNVAFGQIGAILENQPISVTGIYTVEAKDRFDTYTGDYDLHFVRTPGADEGGALSSTGSVSGNITVGDMDSYTFYANAGHHITLTMADTGPSPELSTTLYPHISIFKPDGSILQTPSFGLTTAQVSSARMPTTGTYTVLVKDRYASYTGDYVLHFSRAPGANEGGLLTDGFSVSGDITLGDIDTFTFYAPINSEIALSLTDTGANPSQSDSLYPQLDVYQPDGAILSGPVYGQVVAEIASQNVFNSGIHTVQVKSRFAVNSGPYTLTFSCNLNGANCGSPPQPAAATLLSPQGFESNPTPTFVWDSVPGATWYYLWVQDEREVVHVQWYTASVAGCLGGGNCAISPGVAPYGEASWYIQTWNDQGYGPWSLGSQFSTVSTSPDAPVLLSPSGIGAGSNPLFRWQPAEYATWYQLWISDDNVVIHDQWYRASDLGCAGALYTCQQVAPVSVSGSAVWYLRSWNQRGYGPWSTPLYFQP